LKISRLIKVWLLVGTLDISAALFYYYIRTGKDPENVLRFVASGVFGKDAFSGGTIMSIYGLAFHFLNAFLFTVFFFWIFPKLKLLSKNRILTAIGYGIFIWAVMQLIVLPLSKIGVTSFTLKSASIAISILIVCIGLPLSFMAKTKTAQN
jgi:uncharacterized membrane protein YagU involved in acid resistance